jgi:hypothetical protein
LSLLAIAFIFLSLILLVLYSVTLIVLSVVLVVKGFFFMHHLSHLMLKEASVVLKLQEKYITK